MQFGWTAVLRKHRFKLVDAIIGHAFEPNVKLQQNCMANLILGMVFMLYTRVAM